jgi:ubiquinone/menaquinone biosynthesis C-methylase UbiE
VENDSFVQERYSAAAQRYEPGLCCPKGYNPKYLDVIPREVLERDYGCGDPSTSVRPGETVLDLGCGGGKICFIAAQIVGPQGSVIGIDSNDDMLALARSALPTVAERLGYGNVTFHKGRIEALDVDCERLDQYIRTHPITSEQALSHLEHMMEQFKTEAPLIESSSIDVVISNCVLNLVSKKKKHRVFSEIARVLKPAGRAVISDIVTDRDIPANLQANAQLWSGCYTGALREDQFLSAFAEAGLYGVTLLKRDAEPWQCIEGISFRSVTVVAYKRLTTVADCESSQGCC